MWGNNCMAKNSANSGASAASPECSRIQSPMSAADLPCNRSHLDTGHGIQHVLAAIVLQGRGALICLIESLLSHKPLSVPHR